MLQEYTSKNFEVIFRINTIKSWISGGHEYQRCMATPSMWGYIMANGDVYSCSAFLLDDRFKLGNINEETLNNIWCSDKRIDHACYILNEHDISECRINCRMNSINKYLDKVVNLNNVPHVDFI